MDKISPVTWLSRWLHCPLGKTFVQLLIVLLLLQGWPVGGWRVQAHWPSAPFARLFVQVHAWLGQLPVYAQSAPSPNPEYVDALWVGKADKLLKLRTADGAVVAEFSAIPNPLALATDERRGILWTYNLLTLTAYSFGGQLLRQVPVPAPTLPPDLPPTALAVEPTTGAVWLGVAKTLYQ